MVATGDASFHASGFGIAARGPGARILDNDVIETASSGGLTDPVGIELNSASSSVVKGNRVGNQTNPGGTSAGVRIEGFSTNVLVVGNRVLGWHTGVRVLFGSGGKCRDNFFADVTMFLSDCTDVANNN